MDRYTKRRQPISSLLAWGIKTKIRGRRIPLIASFKLTYNCNLACVGCPFHHRRNENSGVSWAAAIETLYRLHRLGCPIIIFEGGEPFLWRDGRHSFCDLTKEARRLFMRVGATTNGTFPLDVNTDIIWISLDGARETHNELRCGSFDAIIENIRKSSHPRLYIHYTVNRKNVSKISNLVSELIPINQIKGITYQFFYPYNKGEEDLCLSRPERIKAVEAIIGIKKSRCIPVLNSTGSLKKFVDNDWTCRSWMLANAHPDGRLHTGCYVKSHGEIRCDQCGFTPVAEASRAYALAPSSLLAGYKIFFAPRLPRYRYFSSPSIIT